ncbi:MAG TPA: GxxExxY protein, partial [Flavobacterium sp.]|nr:GxxExxY protein [Flavobacterium sp.]
NLGKGFSEIVYKDALEIEFRDAEILYQREKEYSVNYKGIILPHKFYADFVVFGNIILEIKSAKNIIDEHIAQTLNYLKVSQNKVALIVNLIMTNCNINVWYFKVIRASVGIEIKLFTLCSI